MDFAKRVARLRSTLASSSVEAILITDPVNVRYLSGFTGDSSYLLISESEEWILSDRRYEEQIAGECPSWNAAIRGPERRMPPLIAEVAGGVGVGALGLEDHAVSWSLLNTLTAEMTSVRLISTTGVVAGLRAVKDAEEIATLRRAVHCAERAFGVLRASLRPGMMELEAAYLLESAIRGFGGSGVGFPSILAVGPSAALPHYHSGACPIRSGAPLLVDWGARVDGYTSDMTRTLAIGSIPPRMREIYPIVLDAHLAAVDLLRPGARLKDVDAAARDLIARSGYGAAFGHGLGHGIGLEVHESPRLASVEEGVLESGMVITIEPGIYLPGDLGVRIEDDVLVTDSGHEVLGSCPKGLEESLVIL